MVVPQAIGNQIGIREMTLASNINFQLENVKLAKSTGIAEARTNHKASPFSLKKIK